MQDLDRARVQTLVRIGIDNADRLYPYSWSEPPEAPVCLVVRADEEYAAYGSDTIAAAARQSRSPVSLATLFARIPKGSTLPRLRRSQSRYYSFDGDSPHSDVSSVQRHGAHYVVFDNGRPIAWAWTVAGHGAAEEGWAETIPEFRRHGYGRSAVLAWAESVRARNRLACIRVAASDNEAAAFLEAAGARHYADTAEYWRVQPRSMDDGRRPGGSGFKRGDRRRNRGGVAAEMLG